MRGEKNENSSSFESVFLSTANSTRSTKRAAEIKIQKKTVMQTYILEGESFITNTKRNIKRFLCFALQGERENEMSKQQSKGK